MNCRKCGKELIPLEVSLTKKLINRGATTYLCKACLAKEFSTTEKRLDEMAAEFKKHGCTLFMDE